MHYSNIWLSWCLSNWELMLYVSQQEILHCTWFFFNEDPVKRLWSYAHTVLWEHFRQLWTKTLQNSFIFFYFLINAQTTVCLPKSFFFFSLLDTCAQFLKQLWKHFVPNRRSEDINVSLYVSPIKIENVGSGSLAEVFLFVFFGKLSLVLTHTCLEVFTVLFMRSPLGPEFRITVSLIREHHS